jgi:hypothetical protein
MPHGAMECAIMPIICHAVFGTIRALPEREERDKLGNPFERRPVAAASIRNCDSGFGTNMHQAGFSWRKVGCLSSHWLIPAADVSEVRIEASPKRR